MKENLCKQTRKIHQINVFDVFFFFFTFLYFALHVTYTNIARASQMDTEWYLFLILCNVHNVNCISVWYRKCIDVHEVE